MLSDKEKAEIMTAASILRMEAGRYHDIFTRNNDGESPKARKTASEALERHMALGKLARELDVIAGGNL